MRKFLRAAIVGAACVLGITGAHAASPGSPNAIFTYSTAISSVVAPTVVNVSSAGIAGATQVDVPQLVGRAAVEIQNIDSTVNLFCFIGSTNPAANFGRKITPGSSWFPNVADTIYVVNYSTITGSVTQTAVSQKIWCLNDGTSGTSKAYVEQAY